MCGARTRKSSGKTPPPVYAEAMQVRPCREEDLPQVDEILRVSPEAAGWSEESLREFFIHYQSHFLVASQEADIQGFICGRRITDEAEILNLAARRERRRHAIGHRLVQAFLELVAGEGVCRVHLEVRESNQAALGLYGGVGFRVTGKRPRYYRDPVEDAVLMAWDVSAVTDGNGGTG
jgi:[ribosomal protein S18]-alanine N-acetyltransferase